MALQMFEWEIQHKDQSLESGTLISDAPETIKSFLSYNLPVGARITRVEPVVKDYSGHRIVLEILPAI